MAKYDTDAESMRSLRRKMIRFTKQAWRYKDWLDNHNRFYPGYRRYQEWYDWSVTAVAEITEELQRRGSFVP